MGVHGDYFQIVKMSAYNHMEFHSIDDTCISMNTIPIKNSTETMNFLTQRIYYLKGENLMKNKWNGMVVIYTLLFKV